MSIVEPPPIANIFFGENFFNLDARPFMSFSFGSPLLRKNLLNFTFSNCLSTLSAISLAHEESPVIIATV